MNLFSELSKGNAQALAVLGFAFGFLALLFAGTIWLRWRRFEARWQALLSGNGSSLEQKLEAHLSRLNSLETGHTNLAERVQSLDSRMLSAKRFVGFTRFDAFDDIRGEQSFALAIYDEKGNGAVLSSLIGRADARFYCKELVEGRSEVGLSQEEENAIRHAAYGRRTPTTP